MDNLIPFPGTEKFEAKPPPPPPASGLSSAVPPIPRHGTPAATVVAATIEALAMEVSTCRRCGRCDGRASAVPGHGPAGAQIMFIGYEPHPADDALGLPFADESGAVLMQAVRAIGLGRHHVYMTHVLKCYAPQAAADDGVPDFAKCLPFLNAQIDAIRPRVIVPFGKQAADAMRYHYGSQPESVRGKWVSYRGIPVIPTFHPVQLVQNRDDTKLRGWFFADMVNVARHLGLPSPKPWWSTPAKGAKP